MKRHKNSEEIERLVAEFFQDRLGDEGYAKKMEDTRSALISQYKDYGEEVICEVLSSFDDDSVQLHWIARVEDTSGEQKLVLVSNSPLNALRQARVHCARMHDDNEGVLLALEEIEDEIQSE